MSKTINTRIDEKDVEKLERIAEKENIHPLDQSQEEVLAEIEESKNTLNSNHFLVCVSSQINKK